MTYRNSWNTVLIAILFTSSAALAQVEFLQQNWDEETRQYYYTTSQGSRLLPYSWLLALEIEDRQESFLRERVIQLGYLPNASPINNPDTLPVGFVADIDAQGRKHVGLNCAACHTNQISFNGKTYQIDGAPALADVWGLLSEIGESLNATKNDPQKLNRFAEKVLGLNSNAADKAQLDLDLAEFLIYWNDFIESSRVDHAWGRGRLDAFGMIFNRVSAIDLEMPQNSRRPDAPVSYPFLWGTSWESRVQWNGSAPNTNDIERLGRNIGEVLGVFGEANLRPASLFNPYYRTSARRLNQVRLENKLKELWSPVWPEHLGTIDESKALAGKELFENNCVHCHQVVPHGEQDTFVEVVMTPLSLVGTDAKMAENAAIGEVLTGRLEGSRIPGFDPLPAKMPRGLLLANVVRGALLSPFRDAFFDVQDIDIRRNLGAINSQLFSEEEIRTFLVELGLNEDKILELVQKYEDKLEDYGKDLRRAITNSERPRGTSDVTIEARSLSYKARPLDGIWATAPYLHNGSVPNLYELLLPANQRTKQFYVGSIEFDPVHVGFEPTEVAGSSLFDTALPGNSNAGHDDYGTFTEEQRWQLLEYMKTL